MIEGFETRDNTDVPVKALVESVNGHLWKKERAVDQYEKTKWPGFDYKFDKPIVVFGMLRGTGQLIEECSRDGQDFYFFDHATCLVINIVLLKLQVIKYTDLLKTTII